MVDPLVQSLHEILYPDAVYNGNDAQRQRLVEKLRFIADTLEEQIEDRDSFDTPNHESTSGDLQARIKSGEEAETSGANDVLKQGGKRMKEKREFNMDAYQRRYVALEGHLFRSLRKVRLIPDNVGWEGLGYSRCGRTDKGVSALGQVVALWLRSAAKEGDPPLEVAEEMDYAVTLNRALPEDIRVLGWTPVPEAFSARFSAVHREYKYFIVDRGNLDLAAMQQAVGHFVGDHDFRNFCKIDAQHVSNFRRTILDFRIVPVQCALGGARVLALHVRGSAFLWHQVRCMAAVLLMVGRGLERPEVVRQMLDVEGTPLKPQYNMAPEVAHWKIVFSSGVQTLQALPLTPTMTGFSFSGDPVAYQLSALQEPLLFYACIFRDLHFRRSAQSHAATRAAVQRQLDCHLISLALLHTVSERLAAQAESEVAGDNILKPSRHISLLERATEPPLEARLSKYGVHIKGKSEQAAALATADV